MKKFWKICGWGALAIVLLFALILALSPVVKYVVNHYGEQIVGRQLHADKVIVNPFWGGVTIDGFSCKEQNGETNFVSFDHLYVQIAWPRLMAKHVVLHHIHLDGFKGQILKNDDRLNFSDIIDRFSRPDSIPRDTTPSDWTVLLADIRINNGAVRYRDVPGDKQWTLEDLNLHVPDLYFDNQQTNAGIEFALPTGGRVGLVAGMKLQSNRYAVNVNLYDVHTDVVLPLVQDYLDISGLGAVINGKVHVDGSLDNVQNIQMNGGLSIRGLSLRDRSKHEIAALDELRVVVDKGDLSTNTFLLDTLTITGLTGNYEVHENWNTLSRLMKKQDKPAANDTTEKANSQEPTANGQAKPLVWLAKAVTLTGHDLTYQDYSMKNNWKYAIQSLRVDGWNVASNGRNQVKLKATLTGGAKLNMDYTGSLNLRRDDSRMNLKLTGVRLTDFDAICRNYTGYPLEDGVLSVESHSDITGGQLKAENKIVIDQPKVGKKERLSKAKYKNIPVRAGVDLLRSAQNMVVLDVPIAGDVSNPKVKLSKVIGRALLKVFFGPLMGVNDKKNGISDEEREEMLELLGNDTVNQVAADVAVTAGDSVGLAEISEE